MKVKLTPKRKLPSKKPALLRLKLAHGKALETAVHRCSTKKVFLKISQNSPENTCAFLMGRLEDGNFIRLWNRCFCADFVEHHQTSVIEMSCMLVFSIISKMCEHTSI